MFHKEKEWFSPFFYTGQEVKHLIEEPIKLPNLNIISTHIGNRGNKQITITANMICL